MLLSIDTGLRINEVATLTIDALNAATPLAESQHRYELLLSPQVTGVQTKYSKSRQIEISAQLLAVLNEYRASERRLKQQQTLRKIELLTAPKSIFSSSSYRYSSMVQKHEPLLSATKGNPVTAKSIEARWTEFREALLIKSVAGWPFPNPLIPLNSLAGEQAYQALSACSSPSRQPGFRPGRCSSTRLSVGPMSCLNRYMAVSAIERW